MSYYDLSRTIVEHNSGKQRFHSNMFTSFRIQKFLTEETTVDDVFHDKGRDENAKSVG